MRKLIAVICNGKEWDVLCVQLQPIATYAGAFVSPGGSSMFVHIWDEGRANSYPQFDDYLNFHVGESEWASTEEAVKERIRK
jgi:hypothetical protein